MLLFLGCLFWAIGVRVMAWMYQGFMVISNLAICDSGLYIIYLSGFLPIPRS